MTRPMSPIRLVRPMAAAMFLSGLLALCCFALPDPATGGKGGGPIDLLILRGHSMWNFGTQHALDEKYQQMLRDSGYRITVASEWQELTPEYLRQFNTVVYLNPGAYLGAGYFDHTGWWGGIHLLQVRKNTEVLKEWVQDGGGLLIVPALEEQGFRTYVTLQDLFAPYGLATLCACVRDTERAYVAAKEGFATVDYPWTERFGDHPVTKGVQRIYYPAYCTRWDDNYTTIPLKPADPAWTAVAQGMPGSQSYYFRSSTWDPDCEWYPVAGWDEPALFVAREFGRGRLAVCGVSSWHLFYVTYSQDASQGESGFSRVDGIAMTEGDGTNRSDMATLLDNTYRWLAEASLAAGMGGYDAANGVALAPEDHSKDETWISLQWADGDPMCTGPIRPMKILVGARSDASSGHGALKEWAQAAKAAGYDVVCFTETFEDLKGDYDAYAAACRAASDEQVELVPGLDIDTDLGNRFLLVGLYHAVRPHLLTPDRKLFWTGHMMLGMGDILPIAARPQWLATVRGEQGSLPPDLYSHLAGVALATYRDGQQVDDGLFAYQWHLFNSTVPVPVAVHEVDAPDQLARAAATGLQNYVNSDTPAHTAFYYRQAVTSFGGNPMRYYVSSGPLVDACGIDDWQAPSWTAHLKAHGPQPIGEVLVHDQRRVYRRFTPGTETVDLQWHGDLGVQHWFMVQLNDTDGGTAYLSPIRTLPSHGYVRCQDRQNFFGLRGLSYVGSMRDMPRLAEVDVPGVRLAAPLCPKPQMFWGGNRYSMADFVLDSTFVPAGRYWDPKKKEYVTGGRAFGADNAPLFNCMPIPEYGARIRYICYRSRTDRRAMGAPGYIDLEAEITLRKDLQAQGDVWPVIARTSADADYLYWEDGKRTTGKVEGAMDFPRGAVVGDVVMLSPLRVAADGRVGFAPPADGRAKAGTTYSGSFSKCAPLPEIFRSMGLDGPTPYEFTVDQGRLREIVEHAIFDAQDGGVSGRLKGAAILHWSKPNHPYFTPIGVPLRLHGANPNWAAGLWTATGQDSGTPGAIEPFGFLNGVCLGTMLVDQDTDFYFGNLITASNPDLNLAFAAEWTADAARIEVNNPTDKEITATIATATAVKDKKQVKEKVTIPAGATVYVHSK